MAVRRDELVAVKTALYVGEIHALQTLLLCMDEGVSAEELVKRQKELRDSLTVRKKLLLTNSETKIKKGGDGYKSSMRPRWKKELRTYIEREFNEKEQKYMCDLAANRRYKKVKDKEGRASLVNQKALERRLMIADTLTMMERAEIPLRIDQIANDIPAQDTKDGVAESIFYRTSDLDLHEEDMQHLKNTRMHGTLYTPHGAYSILNLGTSRRSIRALGEMRYQYMVNTTLPKRSPLTRLVMLGRDSYSKHDSEHMRLAYEYLLSSSRGDEDGQGLISLNTISALYREAHYIPETLHGIRQLRLLAVPYYWERIASMLDLAVDPMSVYDATAPDRGGKAVACCNLLTGNLNSFSRIISSPPSCIKRIYMFPWQEEFYNTVIDRMGVRTRNHSLHINANLLDPVYLDIDEVEAAFGLSPLRSYYRTIPQDDEPTNLTEEDLKIE